jgi:hypothetical protein
MAAPDDKSPKKGGLPPPLPVLGKRKRKPDEEPPEPRIHRGGAAAVANVPPPPPGGIPQPALPPPKSEHAAGAPAAERDTAVGSPEELSEEVAAFFDGDEIADEFDGFHERTTIPAPYSEDSARLMMQRAQSGAYPPVDPDTVAAPAPATTAEEARPSAVTTPYVKSAGGLVGGLLKNKLVLAGIAGAVICLVVVLAVVLSGGDEPAEQPAAAEPQEARPAVTEETQPADTAPKEAQPAAIEPAEAQPAAPADSVQTAPQPAASKQVAIGLEGAPEGAEVKINGVPVEPPLRLPRSDTAVTLTIHADGYRSFWTKIVPEQDRVIEVKMYRRGKKGDLDVKGGKPMAKNPWR